MRYSLALLILLLLATGPAFAQEEKLTLDNFDYGVQVSGERLSRHDLEGRVVVLYHWCVSCPLSTGGFPFVNQIAEKYRDRGVAVVGVHVRRAPDVAANDVVWYLEHLKPVFPTIRLGWDLDWPQPYLPWVLVFDHEGDEIYRGPANDLERVLEDALLGAPHPVVGGPYEKIGELVDAIMADPTQIGKCLIQARDMAQPVNTDLEEAVEADELAAALEAYYRRRVARAEEEGVRPVERARIYARLARMYAGHPLGAESQEVFWKLYKTATYFDEEDAEKALANATVAYRRLPPAGRYIYHFTDMNYEVSPDPALHDLRMRMIAEYRVELERIVATWPDTEVTVAADDLHYEAEIPEIGEEAARARMARAEKLLAGEARPYDVMEAYFSAYEVEEGYWADDELAKGATDLLTRIRDDERYDLTVAAATHRTMNEEVSDLMSLVAEGGSLLPREKAEELGAQLSELAATAGEHSALATRITAYLQALYASYDGPVQLGVAFDPEHAGPGLKLDRIFPRTAAAAAGLQPGDVILGVDGRDLDGAEALREILGAKKPGELLEVTLLRAGAAEPETLTVTLGRRQ